MPEIAIPQLGLVVLVGVSGSGKSTFAAEHFSPYEVVSSDFCRGLVSNDENDQAATVDAFDVLQYIAGTRLRRGLLTVVDATNVQSSARAQLVKLAREHDVLVDAVVLEVPEAVAIERNEARADRDFGAHVVRRQNRELRKSLGRLRREGFRRVHVLHGLDEIATARITREPSWNDRRELAGPFDLVGDVHGCVGELRTLLTSLGWELRLDGAGRALGARHPEGRTAVFVGDLVDRGPDTPGVLRLVMGMVRDGTALSVSGNHEAKLVRALKGAKVQVSHGLEASLAQLAEEPEEFRADALRFMDGLISHYVLAGGDLVVAHAGLKEAYHGRASGRVRAFALYGDTTGETDEYGLPVRYPWAREYRGRATVVYGHTPVPTAEWVNNTICLDTGVVFGGELTALRYPEREIVAVPAEREWYEPVRPLAPASVSREPSVLDHDDVAGTHFVDTSYAGRVKVPEENAAAALEVMSRFAVDPRWLVYLPPTMSPAPSSTADGFLEHPSRAFEAYAAAGVERVVCEEKHMGSRAIAVVARDEEAAARRFGIAGEGPGAVYTRTGRAFFTGSLGTELVDRAREAFAPLFSSLDSDWLVVDCELLPWSAKAMGLIREQYAAVGAASRVVLPAVSSVLAAAAARGLDVGELAGRTRRRTADAAAYRAAYTAYCRPTDGLEGVTLAPFQILASEGRTPALDEGHPWHLATLATLDHPLVTHTRHRLVELADPVSRDAATDWWLDLTSAGGEGMVVKPADPPRSPIFTPRAAGPEGEGQGVPPDHLRPGLHRVARTPARPEPGQEAVAGPARARPGLEALARFVAGEPLWRVHQAVFGVLALESEPVDPRL